MITVTAVAVLVVTTFGGKQKTKNRLGPKRVKLRSTYTPTTIAGSAGVNLGTAQSHVMVNAYQRRDTIVLQYSNETE